MAIISERIKTLRENFSAEEIALVYFENNHKASLGAGMVRQMRKEGDEIVIKYIAEKLAEKYTGSLSVYSEFLNPAKALNEILEKNSTNSLTETLEILPKDIDEACVKIARKI